MKTSKARVKQAVQDREKHWLENSYFSIFLKDKKFVNLSETNFSVSSSTIFFVFLINQVFYSL